MSRSKKYLAEFVYGATDGTVTTFAIISGVMGANLSPTIVLVLGISNVLADGFSMASSNYLSEKSETALGNGNDKNPWKTAFVTFGSFVLIGMIPLLSFVASAVWKVVSFNEFVVSIVLTSLAFFIIGFVRGTVSSKNRLKTSLETLVVGGVAAAISYLVGFALKDLL